MVLTSTPVKQDMSQLGVQADGDLLAGVVLADRDLAPPSPINPAAFTSRSHSTTPGNPSAGVAGGGPAGRAPSWIRRGRSAVVNREPRS